MSERRHQQDDEPVGLGRRLATFLTVARIALAWEALWPALWPAAGLVGLFLTVALADLLPRLPGWLHAVLLVAFAAAIGTALWRGFRGFRLPGVNSARRRLEDRSGLAHRPLEAMKDALAAGAGDPATAALWRLHVARMSGSIRRLRVGVPTPGLARRDRVALRALVLLVLVVAGVSAWPAPLDRLARAVAPQLGAAAVPATLQLWITPPAYTGVAPLFPKMTQDPGQALEVPIGSTVTAQLHGGRGAGRLRIGEATVPFRRMEGNTQSVDAIVAGGNRLVVEQADKRIAEWALAVIEDAPPTVAWRDAPSTTDRSMLKLVYEAADDYGIETITAVIRRETAAGRSPAPDSIELALPKPGAPARKVQETSFHDLTSHPWAGLPALITVGAVDAAQQRGETDTLGIVIPARDFRHPVARAIIEQRQRLSVAPGERQDIAERLLDIAARPASYGDDTTVFLSLAAARARLVHQPPDAAVEPVQTLLWEAALRVEEGPLSLAERDLRRAQEALMQALARNTSDEELERLMREVQDALNRFLQSMAQQMQELTPEQLQSLQLDPNTQLVQSADLQRLMEQIRDLLRSGAREAARQMLSQLRSLLESLQTAGAARMMQGGSQANESMRQLQELMNRQNRLLDQTFRQWRQRDGATAGGTPRQGAADQRALREALERLRGMLGQIGQQGSQAMENAGRAMGEAADALDRGAPDQAVGPQTEALNQLREAGRGMMQQMMQGMTGNGPFGRQPMPFRPEVKRDPLGRPVSENHGLNSGDVEIPDQDDVQRIQGIIDELRRRAGQASRPTLELDYIDRLLRRF